MQKIMDKRTWQQPYAMHTWGSVIVFGFTCLAFFVCLGAPAWWVSYYDRSDSLVAAVQFGLWRLCVRDYCIYDMTSKFMVESFMPDVVLPAYREGKLEPAQFLMAFNVVFILIVLCSYFAFFIGKRTYYLECIFQLLIGISCVISLTMFASSFRGSLDYLPFGYAFWFGVAASFFFIVNSFVMFAISLTVNRKREERLQMAQMAPLA
ncbi:hypothetical protein CAPTEDRAFT_226318 [Capitella teleta]|uniref:Uncharacterized protein n=1 Tax=Capitella teleta TaxID=283909 RepID=R7UXM9_CAPTE|nr:hypothetical protein CAPTEDRAFT_226318 [Capitella teleta]|eukprot:ELU08151.1 hypothetical protein CAPTEDRAFT_226318 [Capitella teleta]